MRDTILTSLFLASATLASASRLECLHTSSQELAVAASCGDKGLLNYCFSHIPLSTQPEALGQELEHCFVSGGCTSAEAQIEAGWVLKRCDGTSSDLRRGRRQLNSENNDDDDGSSSFAAAAKEPLLALRNPIPADITAMNLPRQTGLAAREDRPASPTTCFSDVTSSITQCATQTTGAESGKKLSCYPTVMASPKCIEGLICKADGQGNPSCMYKESSLGIAGIIIAIVFASAVAISVVAICVLCCRERREHTRIERAAEAARIAKEAKTQATVVAKRPGTAVTGGVSGPSVEGQPLMSQSGGGVGGGAPSSPGAQQQHFPQQGQMPMQQGYGAGNPFADAQHDAHPLR